MNLKFSDRTVAILCVLTVIAMYGLAGTLDASDLETDMEQEKREWAYAQQACWRFYGAQVQPEYTEDGTLICRSRKGEVLAHKGTP